MTRICERCNKLSVTDSPLCDDCVVKSIRGLREASLALSQMAEIRKRYESLAMNKVSVGIQLGEE